MTRRDDPSLSGDVRLWRRIPPGADRVKLDQVTQQPRPSSMNFRDRDDELSVFIASETTIADVLAGHPDFGIAEVTAAEVRVHVPGVILCRDPDPHPAHVLICAKSDALPIGETGQGLSLGSSRRRQLEWQIPHATPSSDDAEKQIWVRR